MTELTDDTVGRTLHNRKVFHVQQAYTEREIAGLAALALDLLAVYGSRTVWDDRLQEEVEDRMARTAQLLDLPSLYDVDAWRRLREWMHT